MPRQTTAQWPKEWQEGKASRQARIELNLRVTVTQRDETKLQGAAEDGPGSSDPKSSDPLCNLIPFEGGKSLFRLQNAPEYTLRHSFTQYTTLARQLLELGRLARSIEGAKEPYAPFARRLWLVSRQHRSEDRIGGFPSGQPCIQGAKRN